MDQLLLAFINTLDSALKKMLKESGDGSGLSKLTIPQLNYIEAIHALGEPTISKLAGQLMFSKASVTAGVQKLAELGYVCKTQSTADRRVTYVSLTDAGLQLVAAKTLALHEYSRFIQDALSEEEARQFEAILEKLVRRFGGDR